MVGDKIYMTFLRKDKKFRYMEFNFAATSVQTSLLYEEVIYFPYTIFMGSNTGTLDGLTVYESYTIATTKKFKTSSGDISFSKETGVIYASIRDAMADCLDNNSGNTDSMSITDMPDAFLESNEAEF